jgi:WD40 repeat protein
MYVPLCNISQPEHGGQILRLRFHPRTHVLASVSLDSDRVCVWSRDESNSLNPLLEREEGRQRDRSPVDVSFHPNRGLIAVAGPGRPVELWDIASATHVSSLGTPHATDRGVKTLIGFDDFGGSNVEIFDDYSD